MPDAACCTGRCARVAVVAVGTVALAAPSAWATASSVATAALPAATATVAPPTALTGIAICPNKKSGSVSLAWQPSDTTRRTGYRLVRTAPSTVALTVELPPDATSYDDQAVSGGTDYSYALSTELGSWTSIPVALDVVTDKHC